MKYRAMILFVMISSFFSLQTFAQTFITSDARQNLFGKWLASCAVEFINGGDVQQCQLCPVVPGAKGFNKASMKDVEMTFGKDTLKLKRGDETASVFYTLNKDTHSFRFNLKQHEYIFRVFYLGTDVFLEDDKGLIMTMKRIM